MGLFQCCIEHRREIAGRGVDDLQHLGGRCLPLQRFVALPGALIEPPLQLGVNLAKFGYLVIERRGHVLTPSRLACSSMILRSAPTSQPRRAWACSRPVSMRLPSPWMT